jgi:hypothetical protein
MQRRRPRVTKLARYTGFRPRTPLKEIILRTAGAVPDAGALEHGTGPRGRARAKDE